MTPAAARASSGAQVTRAAARSSSGVRARDPRLSPNVLLERPRLDGGEALVDGQDDALHLRELRAEVRLDVAGHARRQGRVAAAAAELVGADGLRVQRVAAPELVEVRDGRHVHPADARLRARGRRRRSWAAKNATGRGRRAVQWTHWSAWYVLPRSAGAVEVVMSSLRCSDDTRLRVRAPRRSFVDSMLSESPTMVLQLRHWKTKGIDGSSGATAIVFEFCESLGLLRQSAAMLQASRPRPA